MKAGHGGASGRYDYLKEIALDYAFLLRELGIVRPVEFAAFRPERAGTTSCVWNEGQAWKESHGSRH